jgi:hypothetical protein
MVFKDPEGNPVPLAVDCAWAGQTPPVVGQPRAISFFGCASAPCNASNSVVQAQVTFYDATPTGSIAFGSGMTINSWLVAGANS